MNEKIIDGKKIAGQWLNKIKQDIQQQKIKPGLAVILVGNDPASSVYVRKKQEACRKIGIESVLYHLPDTVTQTKLIKLITQLNVDKEVNGILVQLPLPRHIDSSIIIETINPEKDCDGFHPYNVGRLALRKPALRPCTPKGIIILLDETQETYKKRHAVVVGASNIVGRPMMLELLLAGATVTQCHRFTVNLESLVKQADILIVATGKPGIISGSWIKPNATVIDVGIHRDKDGKIHGDIIDFDNAQQRAKWITPVPGGVGPMTVAMLMQNTLEATKLQG